MKKTVKAPAKLNLFLHVVGKRSDGYHNIETLFCFADIHDTLTFESAEEVSLKVMGAFRDGVPEDDSNIILNAVYALKTKFNVSDGIKITLEKNIPHAAGLGGGSADAAATLKALKSLWNVKANEDEMAKIALSLGADVPACMHGKPVFASGVGEIFGNHIAIPEIPIVLINPMVKVPTESIFGQGFDEYTQSVTLADAEYTDINQLVDMLAEARNDLAINAMSYASDIGRVLEILQAHDGCMLARMSGSGASCFGIFSDMETATKAASVISAKRPQWWVIPTTV